MNYTEILHDLLVKRGYDTRESQERFLHPDYDAHTYDPFLLPDMIRGIDRIFSAIVRDEKICVYSDYDADGIPGATIMHDFFKKIGYANVMFYIPHRHSEGYGLHRDALEKIASDGATLLITVDLGITAIDEVVFARELGIETIITDHHEPLAQLPDAYAIINPKIPVVQPPSGRGGALQFYPDTMLCGCAVAFKLIQGMIRVLQGEQAITTDRVALLEKVSIPHPGWEKWLLDMVGLATLSDMVPLVNENRVLANYGLRVIQKSRRPGLVALFRLMRIRQETVSAEDIVFSITPRLNAASRMAHPEIAFQLLTTDSSETALVIAQQLSKLNDERKLEVARAMRQVHKKLSARESLPNIIVIGDPDWSPGVLGLIASKTVEEYDRSVFVWCVEGDTVKGSCRARNGDHVVDLMSEIADQFMQYGGHEGAGGFSMHKENIHFLEDKLNQAGEKIFTHHDGSELVRDVTEHDLTLVLSDITRDLHSALLALSPFGLGNRAPVVLFSRVIPQKIATFGKGNEHLEIVFQNGTSTVRAIQFFTKLDRYQLDSENLIPIDVLGHIEYSVFMGKGELRLRIIEIKTTG